MNTANEEKCRVVAERLKLRRRNRRWVTDELGLERLIDVPPDFLQPAETWRLVEALLWEGCHISHYDQLVSLGVPSSDVCGYKHIGAETDDTKEGIAQALLDAAYAWAKAEPETANRGRR